MGTEQAAQTPPVGTGSDSSDTLRDHERAVDLGRQVLHGVVVTDHIPGGGPRPVIAEETA
jgi:hypothetical protein